MKINKYWFKPKRYGYGATPITWEGWAVVVVFVGFLMLRSAMISETNHTQFILELVISIVIMIILSKDKTKEDWKWRWG